MDLSGTLATNLYKNQSLVPSRKKVLTVVPKILPSIKFAEEDETVRVGTWLLDVACKRLWKNNKSCHIPTLEAQLLKGLMKAKGKCVSDKYLESIIQKQAGYTAMTNTHMKVQSTIISIRSRIRKALKEVASPIVREPGIGYRFQS